MPDGNGYPSRRPRYMRLWKPGWLRTQYVERERTTISIAAEIGCTPNNIKHALKRLGIPIRRYTMSRSARAARRLGGYAKRAQQRSHDGVVHDTA